MNREWVIRQAVDEDYAGIARVHVDSWRTTYTDIVPEDFLDGMSYTSSEARWRRISTQNTSGFAMFVAEDEGGNKVGSANGGRIYLSGRSGCGQGLLNLWLRCRCIFTYTGEDFKILCAKVAFCQT